MRARAEAEPFDTPERREYALRLGMWTFLASELLLFAGFFTLYAAYRTMYASEFAFAIRHNALAYGSLNTYLLITSSFTVALAVWAARTGRTRAITKLVLATMALGFGFLIVKSIEYATHIREGLLFGEHYGSTEMPGHGARMFWTIYWAATGLHALHVIAGLSVLAFVAVRAHRRAYGPEHYLGLELGALYWHLVDVIWIFLWPLLYLSH